MLDKQVLTLSIGFTVTTLERKNSLSFFLLTSTTYCPTAFPDSSLALHHTIFFTLLRIIFIKQKSTNFISLLEILQLLSVTGMIKSSLYSGHWVSLRVSGCPPCCTLCVILKHRTFAPHLKALHGLFPGAFWSFFIYSAVSFISAKELLFTENSLNPLVQVMCTFHFLIKFLVVSHPSTYFSLYAQSNIFLDVKCSIL